MSMVLAAVVALAFTSAAEDTQLGAGVALKSSTPIESLISSPGTFKGKTVRIDGVATKICSEMGCWMAVAPEGHTDGTTVRLKVEDGAIVFPLSAKGKRVSAEGVFEAITASDAHAKAAAAEHAAADRTASLTYQIKATGAVIREAAAK